MRRLSYPSLMMGLSLIVVALELRDDSVVEPTRSGKSSIWRSSEGQFKELADRSLMRCPSLSLNPALRFLGSTALRTSWTYSDSNASKFIRVSVPPSRRSVRPRNPAAPGRIGHLGSASSLAIRASDQPRSQGQPTAVHPRTTLRGWPQLRGARAAGAP